MKIAALAGAAALCWLGAAVPASAAVTSQAVGATSVRGLAVLEAIACPTAKGCVAVGSSTNSTNGRSVAVNAATGAVKVWSGSLANIVPNAIACLSKTTCIATADSAVATVKVSGAAMRVTARIPLPSVGINALGAVACAGSKICYAVGFEGNEVASSALLVKISAAGKVLAKVKGSGTGYGAIACPSSTTCLVAEHTKTAELILPLKNGRLGAGHKLPSRTYVDSISCYAAKLCYALGGVLTSSVSRTDELIPLNPKTGQPGRAVSLGAFNGDGFSCYSATQCLVVGFTGLGAKAVAASLVVTKGKRGAVRHYPSYLPFTAAACATSKLCYAVGPGLAPSGAVVVKV